MYGTFQATPVTIEEAPPYFEEESQSDCMLARKSFLDSMLKAENVSKESFSRIDQVRHHKLKQVKDLDETKKKKKADFNTAFTSELKEKQKKFELMLEKRRECIKNETLNVIGSEVQTQEENDRNSQMTLFKNDFTQQPDQILIENDTCEKSGNTLVTDNCTTFEELQKKVQTEDKSDNEVGEVSIKLLGSDYENKSSGEKVEKPDIDENQDNSKEVMFDKVHRDMQKAVHTLTCNEELVCSSREVKEEKITDKRQERQDRDGEVTDREKTEDRRDSNKR